jgi:hypothetical protein
MFYDYEAGRDFPLPVSSGNIEMKDPSGMKICVADLTIAVLSFEPINA